MARQALSLVKNRCPAKQVGWIKKNWAGLLRIWLTSNWKSRIQDPLYRKVLVERGKTAVDKIAFNPTLISEVVKAVKTNIIQIEFTASSGNGLIYVNIKDLPGFTFGIMPARF
ncbi:MAG: hypothetical protein HOK42_05500 [Candidatus Marinimicrobia bacterium]|jgi:hypothetical protein|nr:hypothetical protein [Candidatus Neomarinimicrobiota bacterium]